MAKAKKSRTDWFDDKTMTPMIEESARQLDSFLSTMADGVVEEKELRAQEKRLVELMKEVDPRLDDDTHELVTKLLCELTAYDLMQTIHLMQESRQKTKFRG